jgi:hypothetical protein
MIEALRSGDWLDEARVRRIALVMLAVSIALIAWLLATAQGTLDYKGRPIGADFSQVYTAGQMALEGRSVQVWNWDIHRSVQQAFHGPALAEWYGWHYPPPFLLIATALATFPYYAALALWQGATLGPLLVLANRVTGRGDGWKFVAGAPVTMICLMHGHNGFLTALLFGGGLWLLDRKPLLAGLLLGCLVYKPQFALLLPPLLLVARSWPAIVGAAISALGLIALTLVIWGWPAWQAFFDSLPLTREIVIEQGRTGWHKIMSPFAATRAWGLPLSPAYAVQSAFSLAAIGATLWLAWRSRPALRNAAASAAALIATPYVLDYDFVILLVGIVFLWIDARDRGWLPWDKTILAIAWISPLLARPIAEATTIPLGLLTALAVLALAIRRGMDASLITASPSRHSRAASAP